MPGLADEKVSSSVEEELLKDWEELDLGMH